MTYPIDKNSIRIDCLAKRQRLSPETAAAAAQAVAARLLKAIPADAAIIGGYRAVRGEIDITEALERLAQRGHTLCLPVIEAMGKPLFFRRWRPGEALESGRYGIEVPLAGAPVFRPDALIVPAVAFDRAGHRLGYGAGYYDRTIEQLRLGEKGVLAVGAAYGAQQVEYIPPEPHDARLDLIVTETEIITP